MRLILSLPLKKFNITTDEWHDLEEEILSHIKFDNTLQLIRYLMSYLQLYSQR